MRKTVTLSIPEPFFKRLEASSRRRGVSRSQRALELMERQLWLDELRELQDRMTGKARAMGIFTDEDVFERLR
jgi:hypothetical protein